MSHEIRRVAVLGAGVMGSGIATHLANAGIPSYLYDLSTEVATKGLKAAVKMKPASLYRASDAALITPCNYDDDGDKLAECDWIVEVVTERLDIKTKVFDAVEANMREGAVVSTASPAPYDISGENDSRKRRRARGALPAGLRSRSARPRPRSLPGPRPTARAGARDVGAGDPHVVRDEAR